LKNCIYWSCLFALNMWAKDLRIACH
jgi:hypothetical protein